MIPQNTTNLIGMSLFYQRNGNLVKGIVLLTWEDLLNEFGYNPHRKKLLSGLQKALDHLRACGCKRVFIGGSFVSKKDKPSDIDVCYDRTTMNLLELKNKHPVFFDKNRANHKKMYGAEFFPHNTPATPPPKAEFYIDFLQHDKDNDPKGIVQLNL